MSQKLNSAIAAIGIDIGKNSFHVVGHDKHGAIVLRQKWSRRSVELQPDDVRAYRHLWDSAGDDDRSAVTPYWSSIPYPLQMMDRRYLLRRRATPAPLRDVTEQNYARANGGARLCGAILAVYVDELNIPRGSGCCVSSPNFEQTRNREEAMKNHRRTFLKGAGLAGVAIAAGGAGRAGRRGIVMSTAQAAPSQSGELPKGMTFTTLRRVDGYGLGVRTERGILDVVAAEKDFAAGVPTTITAVFNGTGDWQKLRVLVDRAKASSSAERYFIAEEKAAFGPCVTDPEKIVCIGLNYRRHAAETGQPVPKQPILFNKYNSALNCCGGTVAVSREKATQFDYETELVIVIGRTARNVSEADALNYIFGYCTGNDFTARDLQSRSSQWMLGKTLDGAGLIGPWLVTADQVDGDNLKIETHVNEGVRQSSNTSDMIFNCKQLVSYVSDYMTLRPGDIIFTGTPEGVIAGYPKEKQVWLKPGDKLVSSIERLGELHFTLA